MILDELFTAITHVATQLTGRWYPLPKISALSCLDCGLRAIDEYARGGLAVVQEKSWYELLETDASNHVPILYWLDHALQTKRLSLSRLAEAAFRNFQMTIAANGNIISIHSPFYPSLLRWIAKPPLLLTAVGNFDCLNLKCLGVIGSRKASYEALRMSVEAGIGLARTEWAVVSGDAIGCDIAVHEGMLASGVDDIHPIVVFAGGLHDRFPKCNERTFKEILKRGGVFLSERLWLQGVLPRDFPSRNRIVSGMSHAVVVMAAAARSGSLITAQEALEQGRDVYVYELEPFESDVRFEGSKQLIDDGAFPFHNVEHLMEYLNDGYDSLPDVTVGHSGDACLMGNSLGIFKTEPSIH